MSSTRRGSRMGPGMVNFRDLGGLPVDDGACTGHGILYRGDAPQHEDAPPTGLVRWPPALVLDLREPHEPVGGRHPLAGPDTRVVQIPLLAGPHTRGWYAVPSLQELYRGSLSRVSERIAELLELLTRVAGPTLVHCAAGKDRTGVLVAVLLRAAGVSRDVVLADYLRTEPNLHVLRTRLRWDLSTLSEDDRLRAQHLAGTSESALRSVLDELDAAPGGVSGWLSARGVATATRHAWIQRLLTRPLGDPG